MANGIDVLMDRTYEFSGTTVSFNSVPVPDSGYMVGGFVDSLIFGPADLLTGDHRAMTWEMISRWLDKHEELTRDLNVFVGGWIDSDSGLVYIDISRHYSDRAVAIHVAIDNNEIAIWDLGKGQEIRVS